MRSGCRKQKASLSLDLDNQWSYMRTHGDDGWQNFPSYLDLLVPRVLELLAYHGFTITFFVVGQDAALAKNRAALQAITAAGHEIGNHSYRHEPWLHLYTDVQIDAEIAMAEDAIAEATGKRPNGFRGPGFSLSRAVLETLQRRHYAYDASTFPTFIGPFARAYYFLNARLPADERAKRAALFGTWSDGLRPIKPYRWRLEEGPLLEIPVTTMPLTRLPFHISYILFLAQTSRSAARIYFKTALKLCRTRGIEPSILLHPLDFLGADDISALQFFPAMGMTGGDKIEVIKELFADLASTFDVHSMGAYARHLQEKGQLDERQPTLPIESANAAPHIPESEHLRPPH